MAKFIDSLQDKVKTTSNTAALFTVRMISGLFVGLTLALIGEEIVGYGVFSFVLIIVVMTGVVLRISKGWSWMHLLIFNLICILSGLILRMYILIAPG
jgi:hypothetical protein